MGNPDSQQTWPPYDTTKDCSHGFCSFHCPMWCYVIFPPPPPIMGDDEEGTTFSPVVITVIGVLATAFLLIGYYTILSKYCATFDSLFSRRSNRRPAIEPDDEPGGSSRHEVATTWHVSPSNGLDEALISKITVYRYKRGEGVIDGTDCSVCLGEFREDETLRLLPKCSHAFHLQCIDTWLKSHSNCPLCRANIASTETLVMLQLPAPPPDPENDGRGESSGELAVSMEGSESVLEGSDSGYETIDIRDDDDDEDDNANDDVDGGNVGLIRRSLSMDSCRRGRVSIADVLQMSMEDELSVAKDYGLLVEGGAGSSRGCGGERSSKGSSRGRGLHCALSPVPMKRSVSSGRFCFARNGRGRNAILPI